MLEVELTTAIELSDDEAAEIIEQIEQASGPPGRGDAIGRPRPDRRHRPPGRLVPRRRERARPPQRPPPRTRIQPAKESWRPHETSPRRDHLDPQAADRGVRRRDRPLAEVGTVLQVGDGIARVYGLENCFAMEMLEFEHGVTGLALNLESDNVGAAALRRLGADRGGPVRSQRTGLLASVPVGDALVGRIVDPLGNPLDGGGPIAPTEFRPLEFKAPGVVDRQPVKEPLQTGLKAIDSMIPIGRGQRELIIGDRSTGKTAILIDTILNQKGGDVICVYVAIGQKASSVAQVYRAPPRGGRDGLHDHRRGLRRRGGADQVDGAVRRLRDGRVLPLQGPARALHVRRPLEARRRVPADVAAAPPPARARGVSRATSSTSTRGCSSAPASSRTSSAAAR